MAETDGNISTQSANADRPDPPQYARAILDVVHRKRSRALRRLAEENSNPLYAWEALLDAVTLTRVFSQELRKDFARPLEKTAVPNWVLWHLTNVAYQLLAQAQGRDPRKRRSPLQPGDIPGRGEAEISTADACRRLSATMGLSRRGWNAFAEYRTRAIAENAAIFRDFLVGDGVPAKERQAEIWQYLRMHDARNLRKVLAKGADSYKRKEGKT